MVSRPSGWQVVHGGKARRPRPSAASWPSRWRKAQAAYRRFGTMAVAALLVATGCLAIVRFSPWSFLDTVTYILAVKLCRGTGCGARASAAWHAGLSAQT